MPGRGEGSPNRTTPGEEDFAAAMRLLVGQEIARDVHAARLRLREAFARGHLEAGLIEAALTANGSGAPADWAEGLRILTALAPSSAAAARQLELIGAMNYDADGNPRDRPQIERLGVNPAVFRIARFLSPAECAHIATSAADLLEPATVLDPQTGQRILHPVRTSSGATIGPTRQDLVITAILRRIAMATGTGFAAGEPLSVLHYAPGQQYYPHVDTIAGARNQRTHTVLLYLNEGYLGGETRLEASGLTVAGRGGDAVFFANLDAQCLPDPATRHSGLPLRQGTKWLATRWIRQFPYDPWSYGKD